MSVYIYIYIYICVYIYVYIYLCVYINIYIEAVITGTRLTRPSFLCLVSPRHALHRHGLSVRLASSPLLHLLILLREPLHCCNYYRPVDVLYGLINSAGKLKTHVRA